MNHTKALIVLAVTIVGAGAYITLASVLGVREYWVGFLFLTQWGLMEQAKVDRLLASVTGAVTGLILAALLVYLPTLLGAVPGTLIALAFILAAVYALTMGWLPVAINAATMMFLTVATIPHVAKAGRTGEIFVGLAFGAAFFGGFAMAAALIAKRRAASAPPTTAAQSAVL